MLASLQHAHNLCQDYVSKNLDDFENESAVQETLHTVVHCDSVNKLGNTTDNF